MCYKIFLIWIKDVCFSQFQKPNRKNEIYQEYRKINTYKSIDLDFIYHKF
jgi:hypothetical protein